VGSRKEMDFLRREKPLESTGIRIPDLSIYSLVAIPNTLLWLPISLSDGKIIIWLKSVALPNAFNVTVMVSQ
jgi:hypothetical protein